MSRAHELRLDTYRNVTSPPAYKAPTQSTGTGRGTCIEASFNRTEDRATAIATSGITPADSNDPTDGTAGRPADPYISFDNYRHFVTTITEGARKHQQSAQPRPRRERTEPDPCCDNATFEPHVEEDSQPPPLPALRGMLEAQQDGTSTCASATSHVNSFAKSCHCIEPYRHMVSAKKLARR